jgi:hypothetical protein
VRLKDRFSFFSFFLRSLCMKSAHKGNGTSRREEEHLAIALCQSNLEHFDDISFTELFGRIRVFFL